MTLFIIIVLAMLAVAVLYAVMLYNNLVTLKYGVQKALANIDILIKQRHDELPKLVETCKQYMVYEQDTLEKIVNARALVMKANDNKDIVGLGQSETLLRSSLGNLFALAENYPDLKASESFIHLHKRISELENTIADRRELYNESVNLNNTRIEQVPDVFIAKAFHFVPYDLLVFSKEELTDVNIKSLF